jgi:hypothetical protein
VWTARAVIMPPATDHARTKQLTLLNLYLTWVTYKLDMCRQMSIHQLKSLCDDALCWYSRHRTKSLLAGSWDRWLGFCPSWVLVIGFVAFAVLSVVHQYRWYLNQAVRLVCMLWLYQGKFVFMVFVIVVVHVVAYLLTLTLISHRWILDCTDY